MVFTSGISCGVAAHRLSSMQFVPLMSSERMNLSTGRMIFVKMNGAMLRPNTRIVGT